MFYTDDPVSDYDRYCNEQQRKLDRLPECSECGEKIQDEYCFEVNDEYICEQCMQEHKKSVELLIY